MRLGLGQIQGQTPFSPVIDHEPPAFGGRKPLIEAPRLPPRRLNLDNVGPHFRQQPTCQRAGDNLSKVGDLYAVQRSGHENPPNGVRGSRRVILPTSIMPTVRAAIKYRGRLAEVEAAYRV